MASLLELETEIANELIGGQSSAEIRAAIAEAIRLLENDRFWFLEGESVFNTIVDQEYYTDAEIAAPPLTRLVQADSIFYLRSGQRILIEIMNNDPLDHWSQSISTGEPLAVSFQREKMRLYPVPNAVYSITLRGIFNEAPLDLTDDNATNKWLDPRYGYYVTKNTAAGLVEANYNQNQESSAKYMQAANLHAAKLKIGGATRRDNGCIRPSL